MIRFGFLACWIAFCVDAEVKFDTQQPRVISPPDGANGAIKNEEHLKEYNKIYERMYGGMVCDTLVEDVYRELERDSVVAQKAQRKSSSKHVHVQMGGNYTVERMLYPTRENPGSPTWEGACFGLSLDAVILTFLSLSLPSRAAKVTPKPSRRVCNSHSKSRGSSSRTCGTASRSKRSARTCSVSKAALAFAQERTWKRWDRDTRPFPRLTVAAASR